jgi:ABC-type Fe3+/spermidine/putrescine transport system ATPase subunit
VIRRNIMLSIQNLNIRLDDFALQNVNLDINQGDYFVLLGPSGAGKTILFETIAGINIPDSGKIILDGKDITFEKIRKRNIGLVFQDGAVFPHLTAGQNISYPLKSKRLPKSNIREKVLNLAKQMDIAHLLHRKPSTLSGGELRRVAIARTLALNPACLLLDEPLSSIDSRLKDDILGLLKKLNKNGLTILHITHDYREAFYLANKIAVIDKGRIVQQGTPPEIVAKPGSKFVAGFIGIKNYFEFQHIGSNEIIIGDSLRLKVPGNIPSSGQVLIPQKSIRILSHLESESNSESDIFIGDILEMVHFPENIEVKVDIGIPIQILINPALSAELSGHRSISLEIDPAKLDFI